MSHTSPDVGGVTSRADVPPRRYSGRTRLAAATALALTGGLLVPGTSTAAVTFGENITVFPNRDMVVAAGYEPGEQLTVEVLRNDVVIGRTAGPAGAIPGSIGVEVNHGPLGAPQPGDCWDTYTPDIVGGDVVRVTTPRGVDTMTVSDVDFDHAKGTYLDDAGNVVVEGTATGTGFGVEFRRDKPDPRFRRGPFPAVSTGTGTWKATFRPSTTTSTEGLTPAQQREIALTEASWSAVDDEITETTIAELGEPGGVGPGCTGSADPNTLVGGLEPINIASGPEITLSGTAREGVPDVAVRIAGDLDELGAQRTRPATLSPNLTGVKTWSVTVPKSELLVLPDGNIRVTPLFGGAAGPFRTIVKDMVAPGAPTATPAAGDYTVTQHVSLLRPGTEPSTSKVYWEIGPDAAATPDPDQGSRLFSASSPQIAVSSTQTIEARVYDAAGNPGPVTPFTYRINHDTTAPPAPGITPASGSFNGTRVVDMTNAEAGAQIRYTVGALGSPPAAPTATTGSLFTGPFTIDTSQTLAAVAFDAAGNASPVTRRSFTITLAPSTAPNVSPAAGSYPSGTQFVASSPENGVTLRFTTGDGTTVPANPTATSPVYTGPVSMTTSRVIKIAAFNSAGRGPIVQRGYTITTTATAPGRPTIGTAAAGTAGGAITATARWTAPASTGGSAITGYTVRAQRMSSTGTVLGTTTASAAAGATSLSMSLPQTGNYRFSVRAVNAVGTSTWSARSNQVAGR